MLSIDGRRDSAGLESFSDLAGKIDPKIFKALTVKPFEYKTPTAVQSAVLGLLPGLVTDEPTDLLVKAKTGTGKTIGFLTPAIESRLRKLVGDSKAKEKDLRMTASAAQRATLVESRETVGTLIISPTRELASQIAAEAEKVAMHTPLQARLFVGGANKGMQLRSWYSGRKDIVVATPGRLLDLLTTEPGFATAIKAAQLFVMDEADTLLDMGFQRDLEQITSFLPDECQTFMFSATVSAGIRQIAARQLQRGHRFIDCVPANEENTTHEHVPQYLTVVPQNSEWWPTVLTSLATDSLLNPVAKTIIFCPTTRLTELVAQVLRMMAIRSTLPQGRSVNVFELHSGIEQRRRDRVAGEFRSANRGHAILVTSDVSARGVDYPNVTRVIQLGLPGSADVYVHRVGRTGRAGKPGVGHLIVLPIEARLLDVDFRHFPFRPLTVKDADVQYRELASKQNRSEQLLASYDEMRKVVEPKSGPLASVAPDVKDASISLLGYYVGVKGLQLSQLEQAIERWMQEAWGVDELPTLPLRLREAFASARQKEAHQRAFGARDVRMPPRNSAFGSRSGYGSRNNYNSRGSRNGSGSRNARSSFYGGASSPRGRSRR